MTLILISMAIFLMYTLGVCIGFRCIPPSISETFYKLEDVRKNLGYLFTLFCWGVTFTLLPTLLDCTDEPLQWVAFLACAGLGFVGAAPFFKCTDKKVHYIGAFACILFSQIWTIIENWHVPLFCWFTYIVCTISYMTYLDSGIIERDFLKTKPMFWIEVTAFISFYATMLIGGAS